jgi:hypothetical protein
MPITVSWYDTEKTITHLEFVGSIKIGELFDAWQQELDLQNTVSHPVYSLNTMSGVQIIVRGLNLPTMVDFVRQNRPEHLQMTVQAAKSHPVRRGLVAIAALMPHEVHVVETLDQAIEIIETHKDTLQQRAS